MTNTITRSTEIVNTAINLITNGAVRLHKEDTKPTIVFSNQFVSKISGGDNFERTVQNIYDTVGLNSAMSVSFTGLLAVAIALNSKAGNITVQEIQQNTQASDKVFGKFFSDETTNLVEYAYHPWTNLSGDETEDERASANYQRRIRQNFEKSTGTSMGSQSAYYALARQILLNINKNDGEFVPAREDYRATRTS